MEKISPNSQKLYEEEWIDEKCFQVKIYTPDRLLHQHRVLREMTGAQLKQYLESLKAEEFDLVLDIAALEDQGLYTVRDYSSFYSGGRQRSIDAVQAPLKGYKEFMMREQVIPLVNSFSGQR